VTAAIPTYAVEILVNTAEVQTPAGVTDPTPLNNSDDDVLDKNPRAALSVSKLVDDPSHVPGSQVIYTILVANDGPSDAEDVQIYDPKPEGVGNWTWRCVAATGDAVCWLGELTIPGADGHFLDVIDLPANSSVTYQVVTDVLPSLEGELENTVNITHSNDSTPDDNEDTVSSITDKQADLWVTKDDGLENISPGSDLVYTIIVQNDGPSDVTGAVLLDQIPDQIEVWSWECYTATGGASGCDGILDSDEDFEDTINLPAGASLTYRVTARAALDATGSLLNVVRIDSPEDVYDDTPENNEDRDENQILSDSGKRILETNQSHSSGQNVLIGETVTYEISIKIPAGSTVENLRGVDQLHEGLAFVTCQNVFVSDPVAVSTDLSGGFDAVCPSDDGDPRITENGRRLAFAFGNVKNESQEDHWLYVSYTVAVLDIDSNSGGVSLSNEIVWEWNGGTLVNEAPSVTIIEPQIQIEKSVNQTVVPLNTKLTFTLKVYHKPESTAPGFNLVLVDPLPYGLVYADNVDVSGTPYDDFEYEESTTTLRVYWDRFDIGDYSEITFDAVFVGPGPVANAAYLDWKSLPEDPGQQSDYNDDSTWRSYDPTTTTDIVEIIIKPSILPDTGFTPGMLTQLPPQQGVGYNPLPGTWLEIPDLGVNNRILFVPLTDSGWDLTWLSNNIGHLEGSTILTDVGNSVLTAHAVLSNGLKGPFGDLSSLRWGQKVILHSNGVQYVYEVRLNYIVRPENHFVFRQDGYAWLTLITCRDYDALSDTFLFRDVVKAVLIEVIE